MAGSSERRGKAPPPPNPLNPYKDGLRPHFPSKDELLREARAYRQRSHTGKGVAAIALAVAALWFANPTIERTQLATRIGEHAEWSLRDGTRIQLNTGTVAVLENRLRGRWLRLEQGEAMVTAAHGWRSFVVTAGDTEVRDIGTVFNVRRDTGRVDVAVAEGAVEVKGHPEDAPVRLNGGQMLAVRDGQVGPMAALPSGALAWTSGRLVFDGMPLREALAQMQRYRNAPIRLHDTRAGNLRLSGEYATSGIDTLLDALPDVLPVRVKRQPDGTVDIAAR